MHKSEIDGENTGTDANQADALSRSAARGPSVIPFPRKADLAASDRFAADEDPLSSSAPHSLGMLTQAVVLRTANKRLRLKVAGLIREEENQDLP